MTKAGKAGEETKIANEKEAIELQISNSRIDDIINKTNTASIGEKLISKEINVQWKVVKIDDKTYGTDWYYIDKGTEIENYGPTQNRWIVNYETGELKQLKEADKKISIEDTIGVTDGLIFNLDATIIDGATTKEQFESKFDSSKVEFVNVDWNENSGITSDSFKLDGVDDYIKIKYDDSLALDSEGNNIVDEEGNNLTQKEVLAKNGLTFEFYGIWNGGTSYKVKEEGKVEADEIEYGVKGLFCDWTGNEVNTSNFRFSINDEKYLAWTANDGLWNCYNNSDYCVDVYPWNINYELAKKGFKKGKECYITVTLDTSNVITKSGEKGAYYNGTEFTKNGEFYTARCYVNGVKVYDGDYNKEQWNRYINVGIKSMNYICIGRVNTGDGWSGWHYSNMDAYAIRLYNRGLSETEVQKNYEASTNAHALLNGE